MPSVGFNALLFLISSIFDFYLFILIIRFFLALSGADYIHPMTQFVVKLTNFFIRPLRKLIPDFHRLELATITFILLLQIIKFMLIIALTYGLPNLLGLILLAITDTLKLALQVLSFVFLLQLLMYWLKPQSPINQTLSQFTSPFMRPLEQALVPSGTAYTWIIWIVGIVLLQFTIVILINPLLSQGIKTVLA